MSGRRIDRERLADVVLAAVVGALGMTVAAFDEDTTALDHLLVALASAALAFHRAAPRAVLAVATVLGTAYVVHAHPGPLSALPVLGAVHTAARVGHRGVAAVGSAVFLAGYVATGPGTQNVAERAGLLAGWFLCAVVTGLADRNWQAYLRQTEQRALEAERTREEAALRRAGEERLRIARELHDSLTHSISIVKLQAGVAVHLARKRGDEVPPALLAIQEASGEAMRELRSALQVLRADEPTGTPALLVERARAAGLAVDLAVTGDERPLPRALDRAAYRIVQEALTNIRKHAGETTARVRITGAPGDGLHISVRNRQPIPVPTAPTLPGSGAGLLGLQERVTLAGGTLVHGADGSGDFVVEAELQW
jgi:signal transduction histidine kinase